MFVFVWVFVVVFFYGFSVGCLDKAGPAQFVSATFGFVVTFFAVWADLVAFVFHEVAFSA